MFCSHYVFLAETGLERRKASQTGHTHLRIKSPPAVRHVPPASNGSQRRSNTRPGCQNQRCSLTKHRQDPFTLTPNCTTARNRRHHIGGQQQGYSQGAQRRRPDSAKKGRAARTHEQSASRSRIHDPQDSGRAGRCRPAPWRRTCDMPCTIAHSGSAHTRHSAHQALPMC